MIGIAAFTGTGRRRWRLPIDDLSKRGNQILLKFRTGQGLHLGVKTPHGIVDVTAAPSAFKKEVHWNEMSYLLANGLR